MLIRKIFGQATITQIIWVLPAIAVPVTLAAGSGALVGFLFLKGGGFSAP